MVGAQRARGSFIIQRVAEIALPGGPVLQPGNWGARVRQQVLLAVMWPHAGRGTEQAPPRALLHHPAEEP
eukprot:3727268-Alexandrium_andersonii.AAC.1